MEVAANVDVKYAVATGNLEATHQQEQWGKDKTVNGAGLSVRMKHLRLCQLEF